LLLSDLIEIPNWASLAVVIGAVLVAIVVSTPERRGQRVPNRACAPVNGDHERRR
jgi:hypothetical protein